MAAKSQSKLLYRSETDRIIAGVCGGLGEYLDIDPTLVRLTFIVITLAGGSGILLYIVLWLIIPSEGNKGRSGSNQLRENAEEMKEKARGLTKNLKSPKTRGNNRYIVGLIIIGLGIIFLFENFGIFPLFRLAKLWPLLIIFLGFLMLRNR
jgi:phage shock protein C